jgi:hypothetical protein
MYNEIFQVLAVEDDLLPKRFLDLGFDNVVRCKLLALKMFSEVAKNKKVQGDQVTVVQWVGNMFPLPHLQQDSGGVSSMQPSITSCGTMH